MARSIQRVLVVGAGMAGLVAARKLAESGVQVMVLEARERVGGRIHTLHDGDQVIELGAEFIHGRPPELWRLIEEAGLESYEIDGQDLCHKDGRLRKCDEQSDILEFMHRIEEWTGPDIAFADYPPLHELPSSQRDRVINYVQSFNAADYRQISLHALAIQQRAEELTDSGSIFRLRRGYDGIPNFLAEKIRDAGGRIELSTQVFRIERRREHVEIHARNPEPMRYEADKVIIALPLGVLQQRTVVIEPPPLSLVKADQLRMGTVRRFTLYFRERFWAERESINLPKLSFLFANDAMPPVWWTAYPVESNTLTGWIGGPRSAIFAHFTPEQLGEVACRELSKIFSLPVQYLNMQLIRCATHDWNSDPFSGGAYSYIPSGALEAVLNLVAPVEDTLYFAGEHTDTTGHWGTVHAAIRSGLRAAAQVLSSIRH